MNIEKFKILKFGKFKKNLKICIFESLRSWRL